jgi:L-rhamnose isomerase
METGAMNPKIIREAYAIAKQRYQDLGVNVEAAMETLRSIPISLHCWQADDVGGFERAGASLGGGGLAVTGNYPGKARTIAEMRQDLEKVYSLLPGNHRLSLHASYGEFGGAPVDRDAILPEHFAGWVNWAQDLGIGLDFNCTLFSHPKADDGFTLSSKDETLRAFWVEHVKRCRAISAFMGRELGSCCIHNIWIPDGMKDTPIDRIGYRRQLLKSLDEILADPFPPEEMVDAVESKLFGIGSESYVVGSFEFYLSYALRRNTMLCIDAGHFHPTEVVGDKLSSLLLHLDELLLHMTRGVRWDSDHVVTLNDESLLICQEIVRCRALDRVHIGLDFFDASINRIGAYVTGTRALLKALLIALLEPVELLRGHEEQGRFYQRLALLEEMKSMPHGAVWDYYCQEMDLPTGTGLITEIEEYEYNVLSKRQ